MSDNGPHYHCTELMLIIGQWKDWYDIVPQKWIFLEAGEAKTLIDSHHAQVISHYVQVIILFTQLYYQFCYYLSILIFNFYQISQAIKRHVKLGGTIESGNDIETAIHDIAGTKVANLQPNRNQGILVNHQTKILIVDNNAYYFLCRKRKNWNNSWN